MGFTCIDAICVLVVRVRLIDEAGDASLSPQRCVGSGSCDDAPRPLAVPDIRVLRRRSLLEVGADVELGVADRAEFAAAAAEDLSPIPDGSVDVVTTRSVLI